MADTRFSKKDLFHTVMYHRHRRTALFFRQLGARCAAGFHEALAGEHRDAISPIARVQSILHLIRPHHRLPLAVLQTGFERPVKA